MKDIYSELVPANLFGPAGYQLSSEPTSPAVDLQGFNAALIFINVGIGGITFSGTNRVDFKLTHSNDDVNYDAVTIDDVLGADEVAAGGIIKSLIAAHAAAAIYPFGYIGNRRYIKLFADFGGTVGTDTPMHAFVLKGHGRLKPPHA